MKKIYYLLLLILFIPISAPIMGREAERQSDLGTVRVVSETGSSEYRTGDVDHETTSSFYRVIKRSEFEGKTGNLALLLQREAGVQVTQTGGLGSYSTVSLRGSTGKQVSVYLDGVLLNEAAGGAVDLSSISLDDVESIEIYRGSIPVQFGKSSIGGVVNIKTLRNKGGMRGNAAAGYGSFNTKKGSAYFTHKPGDWDYLVSGGWISSDNDFEYIYDKGTKHNKDDDELVKRNNSQFYQGNLLFKTGYDFSEKTRIEFSAQYFDKLQHLPGPHNSDLVDTTFGTRRGASSFNYYLNNRGPLKINTKGSFDYSWQYERYDDSDGRVGLGKQDNEYVTTKTGYSQFIEVPFSSNIIAFNGSYHYEQYRLNDLLKSSTYNPSTRKSLNLALEDTLLFLNEDLILKPLIRYMYYEDSVDQYQDSTGNVKEGQSGSEGYITPQFGIKYKLLYWLTVRGNGGSYVREPSFFELFGDRGLFRGNPDLKAEEGNNFDIGLEAENTFDSSRLQGVYFSTAFFYSRVENTITYIYSAQGVGRPENVSESEIKGIEIAFFIQAFKHLKFDLNYTYQDCRVTKDRFKTRTGNFLSGRTPESLKGRIELFNEKASLYWEYIYESGVYYDPDNLNYAPDKELMNAGLKVLYRDFVFLFEVKNIGNDNYEDFNGYPQPGRACYATLMYDF